MKVVQINDLCGAGSVGKICVAVSKLLSQKGIENYILYSYGTSDYELGIKYADHWYIKFQALKSRIFGNYGFNSICATKRLLRHLNDIKPDIIHLHNLHGHNVHIPMLFNYIKEKDIKVYWTFHDCWAMTAYCPHFLMAKCEKWKTGCEHCIQKGCYSWFFDRSSYLYSKKVDSFLGVKDLTIITPSEWMKNVVEQSFLKDYPIKVINNGIDLDIFKPTSSNFRDKYNCNYKIILLGVAFGWSERKGLDIFIELSNRLSEEYKIVLVGTDDKIDQQLPNDIISIHRTNNQKELAEIYSAADIFVNPTREDTYPTVNMESIACGTPVITFNVGGSPETIEGVNGYVVDDNSIETLISKILDVRNNLSENKEYSKDDLSNYDMYKKFKEYTDLY